MPRQEADIAVRLRGGCLDVHVSEIRESALTQAVQGAERRQEAIALCGAERLRILPNSHHERLGREQCADGLPHGLYRSIAVGGAGPAKASRDPEGHWCAT